MKIALSAAGEARFARILERYDEGDTSFLPALNLAQDEFGCLSPDVQAYLAGRLGFPVTRVRELVTFYSLLHERPWGRHLVLFCRSLTCRMLGSVDFLSWARERLGIGGGETTPDGKFTVQEAECIGACERAPACLINGVLHGPLDREKFERFLEDLK